MSRHIVAFSGLTIDEKFGHFEAIWL